MTLTHHRIKEIAKDVVKTSFFKYFLCREDVSTRHILPVSYTHLTMPTILRV